MPGEFSLADVAPSAPPPQMPALVAAPASAGKGQFSTSDLVEAPKSGSPDDRPKDWIDATFNAVKHYWDQVNPVSAVQGAAQTAAHPIDAFKSYLDQNGRILDAAKDSFKQGDYAQGVRHVVGALINGVPGLGAAIDKAGNEGYAGDVSGMVGDTAGIATNLFGPKIIGDVWNKAKNLSLSPATPQTSPTRASATAFADAEGIPISTGTRTGNPVARNLEASTRNAPGGSGVARAASAETHAALNQTADRLTQGVGDAPTTPETAGAGISQTLSDLSKEHGIGASKAYSRLEDIENHPDNLQTVTTGHEVDPEAAKTLEDISRSMAGAAYKDLTPPQKATVDQVAGKMGVDVTPKPVTKDIALPVDMTAAKTQLKPILDRLNQEMPLAQQQSSRGLLAIRNVVNGEDFIPASVADQNLSALKQLQREAVHPKTKFLANQAVNAVAPLVDKAVAGAGPEATEALNEGRQLTKAKFATDTTLEQLPVEPVQLFRKLTTNADTNINLLRDVQAKAPESIPALGRAHLEGLMDAATNTEGKPGPGTALSNWNKLGDATKQILYPDPLLRKNLDDFFHLSAMVAENPNPSGTAMVSGTRYILEHPVTGIPYALGNRIVAKMLFTPSGANALKTALKLPITSTAGAAAAANILKQAGSDAVPLSKSADSDGPPSMPVRIAATQKADVGSTVTLKNGKTGTITRMNPDGTFVYDADR